MAGELIDVDQREQFLALLTDHEAQLMGFLCAIMPNRQDAEDLLQQTVLTMWQKFSQFEPGTSFVAWGCKIARYKALNLMQARRASLLDVEVIDLLLVTQQEQDAEIRLARRRALSSCMQKLTDDDRTLIESAYSDEHTIKELAVEMGRSAGGVYNSLARIRSALYQCIQKTLKRETYA